MGPDAERLEANQMITGFVLFGCVMMVSGSFIGALWVLNRGPKQRYVGHQTRPGWRGRLPFYRFRCPKHGLVESHLHGYAEILRCPECDKEAKR